jgi:hypothetical protein
MRTRSCGTEVLMRSRDWFAMTGNIRGDGLSVRRNQAVEEPRCCAVEDRYCDVLCTYQNNTETLRLPTTWRKVLYNTLQEGVGGSASTIR